jgi:hypothetical protein
MEYNSPITSENGCDARTVDDIDNIPKMALTFFIKSPLSLSTNFKLFPDKVVQS